MANYIVTGGCGFIGSHLVKKLLNNGHRVTVLDDFSNGQRKHAKAHYVNVNVANYSQIVSHFKGQEGCFHLAAKPSVDAAMNRWFSFHESNLTTSLCTFRAAIEAGGMPVVYASSCAVYGEQSTLPLTEELLIHPVSGYACDKLATELNAFFLHHEYQLHSIGLRFFNVYGPHQSPNSPYSGVITLYIAHLLRDEPLVIYGDGNQTRDFIFVEDIVDNLVLAMENIQPGANIVNLCTGHEISLHQLIKMLEATTGQNAKIEYRAPRLSDLKHSLGSTKKMEAYGFKATHDLHQGLLKTILLTPKHP